MQVTIIPLWLSTSSVNTVTYWISWSFGIVQVLTNKSVFP